MVPDNVVVFWEKVWMFMLKSDVSGKRFSCQRSLVCFQKADEVLLGCGLLVFCQQDL